MIEDTGERRRTQPAVRRQEIMRAARQLAAAQGWSAVTVRAVATRTGCSAPAIYQYFRDKNAILAALAREGRERMAEDMRQAAAAAPGPATRMRALVSAYWQFAETNPELYAVMFGLDGIRCPDHLGEDAVGRSLRACAAELVDKRSLEYNARDLGDLIAAVLHGFVALTLSNCFDGGSVRARELLMAAIEELLRGLSRR